MSWLIDLGEEVIAEVDWLEGSDEEGVADKSILSEELFLVGRRLQADNKTEKETETISSVNI
ncbi:MAG: hypothetical protein WCT22_04835 [Patescibacteria group bacterium]